MISGRPYLKRIISPCSVTRSHLSGFLAVVTAAPHGQVRRATNGTAATVEQRQLNTRFFAVLINASCAWYCAQEAAITPDLLLSRNSQSSPSVCPESGRIPVDIQQLGHDIVGVVQVIEVSNSGATGIANPIPASFSSSGQPARRTAFSPSRSRRRQWALRRFGNHLAGIEHFARFGAGCQLRGRSGRLEFSSRIRNAVCRLLTSSRSRRYRGSGSAAQRFGMAGALLTDINTDQR